MNTPKRLHRSRKQKVIAGVAGGIAEYLNIDVVVVRLVWVLLLIPGGLPGLVPYLICWVIIPLKPEEIS